jgi:C-terminal processing protease CtpA/Prc
MLKRKITAALMAAALTLAPVKNAYALENYWALGEIMEIIDDAYVGEKPNEDEIFYSALHGIADSLDGYSQFFTEGELQSFLSSMETEGYLFGIAIDEDSKGNVYIKEVLKGSTAEEEGLQEKDQIVKVNGVLVSGYDSYYILEILNQRADGTASVEILRSGVPMKKELKKNRYILSHG